MTRFMPQWLQAGTYAASVDRRLLGALWPTARSTGAAVTPGTGMQVQAAAGQVAIPAANGTGSVLCSWDAPELVNLDPSPPSGTNRIDVITCQVHGQDLDGGGVDDFVITYVKGAEAASPVAPNVPAGAVALAQVAVNGGSASVVAGNIADRRPGGLAIPAGNAPRGYVGAATGPATDFSVGTAWATVATYAASVTAGRRYKVTAGIRALKQGAAGNAQAQIVDSTAGQTDLILMNAVPVGGWLILSGGVHFFTAATTGTVTFSLQGLCSAGTALFYANTNRLTVEDIGGL